MDRPVQRGRPDQWVQLELPALQVRPVRLARVVNKAFKGCRAYRGLLV